jgi:cytidine deaminase
MTDQKRETTGPELVIGLVGAIGTDLLTVESVLRERFSHIGYKVESIRLSELLKDLPRIKEKLDSSSEFNRYSSFMSAGTELRELTRRGDALAMLAVMAIRDKRREIGGIRKNFFRFMSSCCARSSTQMRSNRCGKSTGRISFS